MAIEYKDAIRVHLARRITAQGYVWEEIRLKIVIHNPIHKISSLTRLRWFWAFPTGL